MLLGLRIAGGLSFRPLNHRRFHQFAGLDHFLTLRGELLKFLLDLASTGEVAVVQFDFRQIGHLCTLLLPLPEDLDRKSWKTPNLAVQASPHTSWRALDVCGGQEAAAAGQSNESATLRFARKIYVYGVMSQCYLSAATTTRIP
jgi:hypothetical protein